MLIKVADSQGKINKINIGVDTYKIIIVGNEWRTLVIDKPVFEYMLKHCPDFLIKLSCFDMVELKQAITNKFITTENNYFDFYIKDRNNINFYSITYKGIEELK